jgi:hypothetical protein
MKPILFSSRKLSSILLLLFSLLISITLGIYNFGAISASVVDNYENINLVK